MTNSDDDIKTTDNTIIDNNEKQHNADNTANSTVSDKKTRIDDAHDVNNDTDPSITDAEKVIASLNTDDKTGLSDDEALRRIEKFGKNELQSAPPVPKWKKFLNQFKDPLVYLLIVATIISIIAWVIEKSHGGSSEALPFDAIVIILILIANAVLGYIQEAKAESAVQALSSMTAPHSTVIRNGKTLSINTADIVPGDIMILAEGDTVSADARLIKAASLRIAEASLTGESVPVGKNPETLDSIKSLGDRANMVFSGTSVTQGTGRAVVTSTGMRTQVGKIADMLSDSKEEKTPLQKEMIHVSKILGIAVCIIAVVVLATLGLLEGFHSMQDVIDSLLLSVSLAVAAVPEGLATILTVVLALGVQRMANHHAIVKKLSSVETLGSASVICSDKTGTLTKNEMTVEKIITPSGNVDVSGSGYEPKGVFTIENTSDDITSELRNDVNMVLTAGLYANDGELVQNEKNKNDWDAIGDPTEVSLLTAAGKLGLNKKKLYETNPRVSEIPFTSDRKRQTVIVRNQSEDNNLYAYAKGAPDVLLSYCSRIAVNGNVRPLTEGDRQNILNSVSELSSNAYRTLGTAYKPFNVKALSEINGVALNASGQVVDIAEQSDVIENDLIWAGMVGIIDPPRIEVKDAVKEAHDAGIRTVMITGDHPLTASRIASDLGIIKQGEKALTGDELDAIKTDADFDKATASTSVYARVAPEHKLRIVESLQRQDNIVAMTGDGVNDAPAVKTADIGVAMGITGTEVTKESAKMILADDNFSTIVAAVREGRGIFNNIQKFLRYLLGSNVGEVLTVFLGVVLAGFLGIKQPGTLGVTVPLLATQLLWINLLTDAAPALAMGVDPQTENVMNRKPRRITDRVIDSRMWFDIVFIGLIMAAVTLIGMDMHLTGGLFTDRSTELMGHDAQMTEARTMGFTILVFAQLFNALASRSSRQSAFIGFFSNKWLWGAIGLSIILQLVVIYVPILNTAFGTMPLSAQDWIECILLASIVLIASELYKLVMRIIRK